MSQVDWKNWIESIGVIAIVASLIFVGLEIRQDKDVARAELANGTFELFHSIDQELLDEKTASAFIKMLEEPENLTLEEMTQVNSLLDRVIRMFQRENFLRFRGFYRDSDMIVDQFAPGFFGNQYAQSWWRASKSRFSEGIVNRLDAKITAIPIDASRKYYDEIRQGL